MKLEDVRKAKLALLPTPFQRMENLERELDCPGLFIKRDDLTDVGLSGNKIRKLEYLVQQAIDQGCNTLLTYGGPQTNHGRLTVAAAVKNRMKSVLILSGEKPEYCSGNLVLDRMMGADLRFTTGDTAQLAKEVIAEYEANGDKVFDIPIGGSTEEGALGYFYMVKEMMEQMEEMDVHPKYVVTGSGSQGTFCGMWLGAKYFNAGFEVIPVAVNPNPPFKEEQAADLINRISSKYELGITCDPSELKINIRRGDICYSGLGYNVPDAGTREAMRLLARTEAIFTDPCYTGKIFHGFVDMAQNVFPRDSGVVFIHTGGIPGIWSREHLDAAQHELWDDVR